MQCTFFDNGRVNDKILYRAEVLRIIDVELLFHPYRMSNIR